jgi:hypothetical protein
VSRADDVDEPAMETPFGRVGDSYRAFANQVFFVIGIHMRGLKLANQMGGVNEEKRQPE